MDIIASHIFRLEELFHAGAFMWTYALCGAIFGSVMGSFTDLVADRTLEGRKWWGTERSRCPACGKVLGAAELVPVFSFIIQKRKCRGCGSLIPYECLWAELLCMLLYAMLWGFHMPFTVPWILGSAVIPMFMIHIITDLKAMTLYDVTTACIFIAALGVRAYGSFTGNGYQLPDGIVGSLIAFCVFMLFSLAGAIGFGDTVLIAGLGMITGTVGIAFSVYAACIMCMVWYIFLCARGCAAIAKDMTFAGVKEITLSNRQVPYGPWLCLGAYLWIVFFI